MERQILWNSRPNEIEEAVQWWFVIVNEQREIGEIKGKIFEQLAPVRDISQIDGKKGDCLYKILSFISPSSSDSVCFAKIYGGKIRRERKLYHRKNEELSLLEDYVVKSLLM